MNKNYKSQTRFRRYIMDIIYEKDTDKSLDDALKALKASLKDEGFGVLWELNFKDKLQEKGLDFENPFVVLEVCNPKKAKEVLEKNIHVGYVLPCKMVVRRDKKTTYIGMLRPERLMALFDEETLTSVAQNVEASLMKAIEASI